MNKTVLSTRKKRPIWRKLFRMFTVALLEWRRDKLPPPPPNPHDPFSWVTLLFCVQDSDGVFRNHVTHFESEEQALRGFIGSSEEFQNGFRGAYREVKGFLAKAHDRNASISPTSKVSRLDSSEATAPEEGGENQGSGPWLVTHRRKGEFPRVSEEVSLLKDVNVGEVPKGTTVEVWIEARVDDLSEGEALVTVRASDSATPRSFRAYRDAATAFRFRNVGRDRSDPPLIRQVWVLAIKNLRGQPGRVSS